jgi:ribose-phosphate pyrophosphokinase
MQEKIDPNDVRFFAGRSHHELAAEIAKNLDIPLENTLFDRYSNDNMAIQLGASVRGRIVYILQSLIKPVSDNLFELFMMLDIARTAGAREVHAIIPYFSYARSDKKDKPRISITARLVADLLQAAGATHVMTMTLHSPQVHGFFSVPTDPLTARPMFVHHFQTRELDPKKTIVVAPDMGRATAATRFAELLKLPVAAAEKRRISDKKVKISRSILRQVKDYRHALVYDDEIATGTSVLELSEILLDGTIKKIDLICTHGLFTDNALVKIGRIPEINEIVTTNTVPIPMKKRPANLTVLSVGSVFSKAILHNYLHQSIGDLFTFGGK